MNKNVYLIVRYGQTMSDDFRDHKRNANHHQKFGIDETQYDEQRGSETI